MLGPITKFVSKLSHLFDYCDSITRQMNIHIAYVINVIKNEITISLVQNKILELEKIMF